MFLLHQCNKFRGCYGTGDSKIGANAFLITYDNQKWGLVFLSQLNKGDTML